MIRSNLPLESLLKGINMSELKIGDVVQLKSGGPLMTIDSIGELSGAQAAWVSWFDKTHNEKSGSYPLTSLKIYKLSGAAVV